MLRHVLFTVNFFPNESERASSQKRILCLLEALVWINRLYLREHPETPLLYQSGIKYLQPEQFVKAKLPEVDNVKSYLDKKGAPTDVMADFTSIADQIGNGENFRDIPQILANGGGDCDNVASWRVAELRERGIPAKPYITWRRRPDGGMTYHVIVLWPDGTSEDPSLLLGMGGSARAADRQHEEEKLGERLGNYVASLNQTGSPNQAQQTLLGAAISSPQDYSQLQYSIPFQTDESYADWSPTRPQIYYQNPYYPSLTPKSGPLFNTRLRDPDDDDRFDGVAKAKQKIRRKYRK